MYLLDTNVVSALRRPEPHGAVIAFINVTANCDFNIGAPTIGDLQNGVEDAMIVAIASLHGLVVATRNVRDFVPFGVKTLNPFR